MQAAARQVLAFMASGQLVMNVGSVFALKDAAQAQKWVESRRSTGKVLIDLALRGI